MKKLLVAYDRAGLKLTDEDGHYWDGPKNLDELHAAVYVLGLLQTPGYKGAECYIQGNKFSRDFQYMLQKYGCSMPIVQPKQNQDSLRFDGKEYEVVES